jgi:anti-sigma factor RsiW
MTEKPSNYELDDELLSAYLYGELSADERAAVEARLATDPAAQQLLHELRSVSQSVQAMPTESLGRDLSEDIIRRARETASTPGRSSSATAAAAAPEPSRLGDTIPKIRIFNSKRAWIWASMALAAGLLIMIVQSGDESAKKLPPVAARNREPANTQLADEAGKPTRREITAAPASKSASPPPSSLGLDSELHDKVDALGTSTPVARPSVEAGGGRSSGITSDSAAASPPVAAASPSPAMQKEREIEMLRPGAASNSFSAAPSQVASDKRANSSQPTGSVAGPGGAPAFAAEKQKSELSTRLPAQRFVVVRVVAKPDAIKNGSFDRLLADNKIEFVPQPEKNQSLSFSGGKPQQTVRSESAIKQLSKNSQSPVVDAVLVEAPAPAIESCLVALNKNTNDFPSIAVSEESQSHDRFDAKPAPVKKLAETSQNLTRFSRGNVPAAQQDAIDSRYYLYSHDFDKANKPAVNGSPRAGGLGGQAGTVSGGERDANGDKGQLLPEVRRARSLDALGINESQLGEPATPELNSPKPADGRAARIQLGAQAPNQPMSQRKPKEEAEAKADNQNENWKVLFVFTPEEAPVPSAQPSSALK